MTPSQKSEQIADIQAGLDEADKGEFATAAEVIATIRKYTKRKSSRRSLVVLSAAKDLTPAPKSAD